MAFTTSINSDEGTSVTWGMGLRYAAMGGKRQFSVKRTGNGLKQCY